MKTSLLAAFALSLFAAAASAQTVTIRDDRGQETTTVTEPATQTASTDARATEPAKPHTVRSCLAFTGSRVTASRNLRAVREGRPQRECANGTGRAYSEQELQGTGLLNVGDALRSLDTGIR
jgi:hypothetical protein